MNSKIADELIYSGPGDKQGDQRYISVIFFANGELRLEGYDIEPYGTCCDHWFGYHVKPIHFPTLIEDLTRTRSHPHGSPGSPLLDLLVKKYEGNKDAVNEFKKFCETNSIPHEFKQWRQ